MALLMTVGVWVSAGLEADRSDRKWSWPKTLKSYLHNPAFLPYVCSETEPPAWNLVFKDKDKHLLGTFFIQLFNFEQLPHVFQTPALG